MKDDYNVPMKPGAVLEVNGKHGLWTPGIFAQFAERVGPRMQPGEAISAANYYEPRPYRDEYNRGDPHFGFTYTVQPGDRVAFVEWTE